MCDGSCKGVEKEVDYGDNPASEKNQQLLNDLDSILDSHPYSQTDRLTHSQTNSLTTHYHYP